MKRLIALMLIVLALAAGCSQAKQSQAPAFTTITAADLYQRVKAGEKLLIVDVRTEEEWKGDGHIESARLIPLQSLPDGAKALSKNQEIYVICRSGNRSLQAVQILSDAGFKKLVNVSEGMQGWVKAGGPIVK